MQTEYKIHITFLDYLLNFNNLTRDDVINLARQCNGGVEIRHHFNDQLDNKGQASFWFTSRANAVNFRNRVLNNWCKDLDGTKLRYEDWIQFPDREYRRLIGPKVYLNWVSRRVRNNV